MAFNDWGSAPVYSTQAQPVSNPSTATLCAEIDSTQLGSNNYTASQTVNYQVTWILGADTNATWQLECVNSTATTASSNAIWVKTPTAASAQFVTKHALMQNGRFRARIGGSTFTAQVTAYIQAEPIT